jgi:hypothetical protein
MPENGVRTIRLLEERHLFGTERDLQSGESLIEVLHL